METTTIIITAVGIITFAFILYGVAVEGRKAEARELKHPYPFKKMTLIEAIAENIKNASVTADFKYRNRRRMRINDEISENSSNIGLENSLSLTSLSRHEGHFGDYD